MMKNNLLCLVYCGLMFSASYGFAQEPLTTEVAGKLNRLQQELTKRQRRPQRVQQTLERKKQKKHSLLIAIGNAYLSHKCPDQAQEYMERAMKVDSKSAPLYMLAGDIALSKKNVGTACGYYEQAILFDANCYDAYYKYSRAYLGVNPQLSIDMLEKLKASHPELPEVNRELGNAYYQAGNYSKAKTAYDGLWDKALPTLRITDATPCYSI